MNSYAEAIEVYCPTCQRAFQGKLWLIVDTVERPDLVKQTQRGKLHRMVCPDCGQVAAEPDKPLLLYRRDAEPVLVFSPAQETSQEEDQADAKRLIAQLKQSLGDQWQDGWMAEGLQAATRELLPALLDGEAATRQMQVRVKQTPVDNWSRSSHDYWNVLQTLLQVVATGREQEVNSVIAQYRQQFGFGFIRVLQEWTEAIITRSASNLEVCEELILFLENLGTWIMEFPLGVRPEDIQVSIACYESALKIYNKQDLLKKSHIYTNLSVAYLNQAELGIDSAANLKAAVNALDEAVLIRRHLGLEHDLASSLNNLGNIHLTQAEFGIDSAANLKAAVNALDEAVLIRRHLGLEHDLASSLNNLGLAYSRQAEFGIDSAANLKAAVNALDEAVLIRRHLGLEHDLTSSLNNLGLAYSRQAEFGIDSAANLKAAVNALDEAIVILRCLGTEKDIGLVLTNLGITYCSQAELGIDSTTNLNNAIIAFIEAAAIQRKVELNRDLGLTLMHLGLAYCRQAEFGIDSAANLKAAVNALNEASSIQRNLGLDYELALTLANLGTTHSNHVMLGIDPVNNLKTGIMASDEAISILRRLRVDQDLSTALDILGGAYVCQAQIDIDSEDSLKAAITIYDEVVEIAQRLGSERRLYSTFINLGNTYRAQADLGINCQQGQQRAIDYYRQALQYFTPKMLPVEALKAARGLGNLHFTQGNWQLALNEGYCSAIIAVEQIRTWASSDERRQEVLENTIEVYNKALQCYINLGQHREAILLSERVRSRHLVDLMHSNDLYQGGEIPEEIQQYLEEYEALQQRINQLRQQQRLDDLGQLAETRRRCTWKSQTEFMQTLEELLQQKEEAWRKLRAKDPVLAGQLEVPPFDFADLAKLIAGQPTIAILSFYSTSDHTYILVVGHGETGITCEIQTCLHQGYYELHNWIRSQWFVPYQADFETWIDQMPKQLQELAKRLQLDQLITTHLQGIEELILIPHIFLHLIPFAALPLTPSPSPAGRGEPEKPEYLGDKFRLRVVPSAQILKYCHDRENNGFAPAVPGAGFGSVEDATGDKPIVASGFEQVAQLLQIPANQRLRGPQQATLSNYRQLTRTPHIRALHSIHHAGSDLENPMESALLLANHERLTLGQLMSPGWRMPHLVEVFLSCCETNLGRPNVTDDIVTLSTGFLCAGARVVISTLWSVDALATALFCDFYYQFRETGCDRPTALQQSQQAMRNLSGEQLKTNYEALYQQLEQQQQQAEQNRQDYRKQLKSLSDSHPDYGKAKKELDYWTRLKNDLDNALYWFDRYQKQAQPFADPYYWSGFVCQGLR